MGDQLGAAWPASCEQVLQARLFAILGCERMALDEGWRLADMQLDGLLMQKQNNGTARPRLRFPSFRHRPQVTNASEPQSRNHSTLLPVTQPLAAPSKVE